MRFYFVYFCLSYGRNAGLLCLRLYQPRWKRIQSDMSTLPSHRYVPAFGLASHASWHAMSGPSIFHTCIIYPLVIRQQGGTTETAWTSGRTPPWRYLRVLTKVVLMGVVNSNNIMLAQPQTLLLSHISNSKSWHVCTVCIDFLLTLGQKSSALYSCAV